MSLHNTLNEIEKTIRLLKLKRKKAVKQIEEIDRLLVKLEEFNNESRIKTKED